MESQRIIKQLGNTDTLELILKSTSLNAFQTFLPVLNECLAEECNTFRDSQEFTQLNNLEILL